MLIQKLWSKLQKEKNIAQFLCISLYGPFTNLPFNFCAFYFDSKAPKTLNDLRLAVEYMLEKVTNNMSPNGGEK